MDDEFHTLTIDWREDQVDYFIDGVLHESFDTNVAMGISEVIIGFRQRT
jgi:beta-glucanase (GH16 family)